MNYFKGVDVREKYDMFYEKVLKVKDVVILIFVDLAQRLLVDYIRDVRLQLEASDWFSTWWTGARGIRRKPFNNTSPWTRHRQLTRLKEK